ncbi:hypothetical protein EXD82_06805 [Peptacetobacter hominis]|uniref:Uncharacterized protein n=1 Tax=Peptacetobacter hominis TaxID=2743610 RepID=A0A544QUG6_9FIRM|nr:hypothetical protein [Peptacetobacter hominis]TQQ84348.1 hypothetical protein EXD82_06805 [Peptacetobacter hominis]
MERFDSVSLDSLSVQDLLVIIKALEYTHEHTQLDVFKNLRNNIVNELCFLAEVSEEEFIEYIESYIEKL